MPEVCAANFYTTALLWLLYHTINSYIKQGKNEIGYSCLY